MAILSFPFYLKKETNLLSVALAIRSFGIMMVLLFEPIYLYLYFQGSLSKTFLFFGIIFTAYGLLAPLGTRVLARKGVKHTLCLSSPFLFTYYLSLFFLPKMGGLLVLAIIFRVLSLTFFGPSFHTAFTRFSSKEFRGKELGRLNIFSAIAITLGPLSGGIILEKFGYPVLFILVSIILLLSTFPLLFSKDRYEVYQDSYRKSLFKIFKRKNWRTTLAFGVNGAETQIHIFVWPIFLFILAIQYSFMGILTAIALALGIATTFYVGKLADKYNRKKLLNKGALLLSAGWVIKCFAYSPFTALLAQSLFKVFRVSAHLPFGTILYDMASQEKEGADEFITYWVMIYNLMAGVALLVLSLLFLFISEIRVVFLLAALFALLFRVMPKTDEPFCGQKF